MMSLYRTIKGTTGTYKRRRERSLGPLETFPREMVSRRKILSRSRDDLNLDQAYQQQEEEEDIWYQKDKLFKEHIQEVLDKWTQIDDEIWAKVIVFERNRRVAKAYARAPVLTINGSDDGFDGMRIGLCGFDNPMRDQKTDEVKRHVGQGVKIKMDDAGNILVRRYSKGNVYVKSTASAPNDETAIGADIMKLPNQALESEKIVKLFDMKKFQSNVNRELRRAYPDRRRLETQCLSLIAFVKSENDILDCPIWVLIVNVVAMDMLKSKLPPVQRPVDIKNRPRIPIPDEDPYSVAGNGGGSGGSSGSSGFGASGVGSPAGHVAATREQLLLQTQQLAQRRSEKPPKLPPRDNIYHPHDIPKPDYDDIEDDTRVKSFARGKSDKGKDNKKYDDPYYCGLRARVPNFVKSSSKSSSKQQSHDKDGTATKRMSIAHLQHPASLQSLHQLHQIHPQQHLMAAHQHHQQMMWHARSFESGIVRQTKNNYKNHKNANLGEWYHQDRILADDDDYAGNMINNNNDLDINANMTEFVADNLVDNNGRPIYIPKPKFISTSNLMVVGAGEPFIYSPPPGPLSTFPPPAQSIQPPNAFMGCYINQLPTNYGVVLPNKWRSEDDIFASLKRRHSQIYHRHPNYPIRNIADNYQCHQPGHYYPEFEVVSADEEESFSTDSIDRRPNKSSYDNSALINFMCNNRKAVHIHQHHHHQYEEAKRKARQSVTAVDDGPGEVKGRHGVTYVTKVYVPKNKPLNQIPRKTSLIQFNAVGCQYDQLRPRKSLSNDSFFKKPNSPPFKDAESTPITDTKDDNNTTVTTTNNENNIVNNDDDHDGVNPRDDENDDKDENKKKLNITSFEKIYMKEKMKIDEHLEMLIRKESYECDSHQRSSERYRSRSQQSHSRPPLQQSRLPVPKKISFTPVPAVADLLLPFQRMQRKSIATSSPSLITASTSTSPDQKFANNNYLRPPFNRNSQYQIQQRQQYPNLLQCGIQMKNPLNKFLKPQPKNFKGSVAVRGRPQQRNGGGAL